MQMTLNILGVILLILVLLGRSQFEQTFRQIKNNEPRNHTTLRLLIIPSCLAFTAFVLIAVQQLVAAGYLAPAGLLVIHLGLLANQMRQRPQV